MFEYVKADLRRFSSSGNTSARTVVAGLVSQGFQAVLVYRFFHWLQRKRIPGQPLRFICERFIEITTGISIPASCRIGKGLRIHHFGGIIFHPTVQIGDHCTVYQGVTIGDRGGTGGAAKIGNHVLIGAGAKIIGEITIGDDCIIGANAVVTKSMPAGTVAVGSPCQFRPLSGGAATRPAADPGRSRIPRVMDLRGTYKGGGGPDKTVLNSAAQHDPERVYVFVTYIRQPQDTEFSIPQMAQRLGINYRDVPDRSMLDWNCLKELKRLLREHDLTVVHAHDDKTLLYAWLLRLTTPGLKIMYTCHSHAVYGRNAFGSAGEYIKFKVRQRVLVALMQRFLKPVITVSHDTRKRLVRSGLREDEVAVLHNGIDISAWRREGALPVLREELSLAPDAFIVGTVARITYDKDLPTFYRVAELVASRVPGVIFVIVGDGYGNELARAREEVARRGLERIVHFTGHRNDLRNIYISFDIFLMTSRTEGMPNTLLEAMALGVPSVSTIVGGVPELLENGKGGFLAPVGDAEGLAGHVVRLLLDSRLRDGCARMCRERIENDFSFFRRVQLMEDYYGWFAGSSPLPETARKNHPDPGRLLPCPASSRPLHEGEG